MLVGADQQEKNWRQHRRYLLTSSIVPPSGLIRRLNLCFHCLFMSVHTRTRTHTHRLTLISSEDKMLMSSCSTSNLILQRHRYYTRNITRWHLTLRVHLSTEQQRRSEIFFFDFVPSFVCWFCVFLVLILSCAEVLRVSGNRSLWFSGSEGSQVLWFSGSQFFLWFLQPHRTWSYQSRFGCVEYWLLPPTTLCRCYCSWPAPQGIHSAYKSNLAYLLAEFYCRLLSVYWHVLSKGNRTYAFIWVENLSSLSGSVSSR